MFDATLKSHPATGEDYLAIRSRGHDLLNNPFLNKGMAFSREERIGLGLSGLMPSAVRDIETQLAEALEEVHSKPTNLQKNIFLTALLDRNETLFYRLVHDHISEMVPLIYTPVVGEAIANYSHIYNRPRGIYLSYPDRDHMDELLDHRWFKDVDLICVTDGERILGLGDQGAGGIGITVGKLSLYTICSGINPTSCLPIGLDVGTNNQQLLDDPEYVGWRHERVHGADYDSFIEQFVETVQKKFPHVYLHWEDFGKSNATRILNTYRERLCTFNDDIQGTGAVAVATVSAALKTIEGRFRDQRVAFLGAGTAGVGIADQLKAAMIRDGLSEEEASKRFYLIDINGLLQEGQDMEGFQKPYAFTRKELEAWKVENPENISLGEVVANASPTILIGVSSQSGAFSESIVRDMAEKVERPIIMPLSNPTSKCEAVPADLVLWTEGRAIIATGSPFEDVDYAGKTIPVSQCNNAFIFPGIGLGVVATKPKMVSDGMIQAAVEALAECAPSLQDPCAALLPQLEDARKVCRKIALAVGEVAYREELAQVGDLHDLELRIDEKIWKPRYLPYRPE